MQAVSTCWEWRLKGKAVFSNPTSLWVNKVSKFPVVEPGGRKEQRAGVRSLARGLLVRE